MTNKFFVLFVRAFLLAAFFISAGNLYAQETAEKSVKIGVLLDLSGETSGYGISTLLAIKMAADEINAAGGIGGEKIELLAQDTQGKAENAKNLAREMTAAKKVDVLVGEITSSNTSAIAEVAQKAGVPLLAPISTLQNVTEIGDYIFRVCYLDTQQSAAMAQFAFQNLQKRRAVVFADFDSDYSRTLSKNFAEKFSALGGKIIKQYAVTATGDDYTLQLRDVAKLRPDVIYIPGYYNSVGDVVSQLNIRGIQTQLLGADGWDSPFLFQKAGAGMQNAFITNHFSSDAPLPSVQKFVAAHKKLYNVEPDSASALGYDAVYLIADAVRRSSAKDGAKLRDALAETKNFVGVTGKIEFDANRNPRKAVIIEKVSADKFKYSAEIAPQ